MITRKLLLGDEAIALGAIHAGISGVYAYPGTPSTEITEFILQDACFLFLPIPILSRISVQDTVQLSVLVKTVTV